MLNRLFQQLGHQPLKQSQDSTQYKSPWNTNEKTASCFVFRNDRLDSSIMSESDYLLKEFNYKDNSSGNGGDIYNFIMNYFNLNFPQAKNKINDLLNLQEHNRPMQPTPYPFSFNQQKESKKKSKKNYKIKKVSALNNKALENYLIERGLKTIELHKKYISEIYYQIDNKNYFALSFANDVGGREIRNKYFKSCFGEKNISLIVPTPKDKRIKIFEGFMDFLSYLEINKNAPLSNYLVLNSANQVEKALNALNGKFELLELYLDNDRAGNEATEFFMQNFSNSIDKRVHYKEYKDLNDFLVKGLTR